MYLYGNMRSKKRDINDILNSKTLTSIDELHQNPDSKVLGQLLYVKKYTQHGLSTHEGQVSMSIGSDKAKMVLKTCHRIFFFKDCVTGSEFVVVSEDQYSTIIMHHKGAKVGDCVYLYLPKCTEYFVDELPVIEYRDVLVPDAEPIVNVVKELNSEKKFSAFHLVLPIDQFKMCQFHIAEACSGTLCDGTQSQDTLTQKNCPCPPGTGMMKNSFAFQLYLPMDGEEHDTCVFSSLSLCSIFFDSCLSSRFFQFKSKQLRNIVLEGLKKVEQFSVSGWVGYGMEMEDQQEECTHIHISSVKLQLKPDHTIVPLKELTYQEVSDSENEDFSE